jgi:hypothetical protein
MKNLVETLVKELQNQGIKVDAAAILNIPNSKGKDEVIDKTVNDILSKMGNMGFPTEPKTATTPGRGLDNPVSDLRKEVTQLSNQLKDPEQCYCPNCFNFETFEQVLTKRGGKFDYVTVQLGGKNFNIKYWTDGNDENIMISPEEQKPTGTLEELQVQLNQAVQEKDYNKAQVLINMINELKNQKGGING